MVRSGEEKTWANYEIHQLYSGPSSARKLNSKIQNLKVLALIINNLLWNIIVFLPSFLASFHKQYWFIICFDRSYHGLSKFRSGRWEPPQILKSLLRYPTHSYIRSSELKECAGHQQWWFACLLLLLVVVYLSIYWFRCCCVKFGYVWILSYWFINDGTVHIIHNDSGWFQHVLWLHLLDFLEFTPEHVSLGLL